MEAAGDIVPLIEGFAVGTDVRFALTSRWLAVMFRLFHPQLAWLLHERDRELGARGAGFAEDEAIEVATFARIDVDAHLAALDRAWRRRRGAARERAAPMA